MSSCEFEFESLDTSVAPRFTANGTTTAHTALGLSPQAQMLEVVAAARAEAEAIRAEAFAQGHAEGLVAAQEQAAQSIDVTAAAFARATEQVFAAQELLAAELEGEAVTFAFALAEKVLMGAIEADPARVLDVIRGALRGMLERERVTLLVNPADMELVRATAAQLQSELGGMESCEVQAERRVARGGAIVRTADGEVDATVEAKLARAREVVAGELG